MPRSALESLGSAGGGAGGGGGSGSGRQGYCFNSISKARAMGHHLVQARVQGESPGQEVPADLGCSGGKGPQPVAHRLSWSPGTDRNCSLAGPSRLGDEGSADHLGGIDSPCEEPLGEQHRCLIATSTARPARAVAFGPSNEPGASWPGAAPGPELSVAVRASQLPGLELSLDNVWVVSYDEQSGASGHPRGPLRSPAKRMARGSLPFRTSSRCRWHHRQRNHANPSEHHHAHCRFTARPSPI